MITFKTVKLENFLSFAQSSFELDGYNTPVLVVGENRDSTSAGSNGAGKSGLFEAIPWALFGFTLRGLAQRDVVRRGNDAGCFVTMCFDISGEGEERDGEYIVTRCQGRKNNALTFSRSGQCLEGKDKRETQVRIESTLGFDFKLFCESVVLGQDSLTFAGATDAEKKRVLESVTGIDKFDAYLMETKRRLAEAQKVQHEQQYMLGQTEAAEHEVKQSQERAEVAVQEFRARREREVKELEQEYKQEETRAATSVDIKAHLELLRFDEGKNLRAAAEYETAREASEEVASRSARLFERQDILKSQIRDALDELNDVKDVCPTCKRPFAPESLEATRSSFRERLQALQKALTDVNEGVNVISGKVDVAKATTESCRATHQAVLKERDKISLQRMKLEGALKLADAASSRCTRLQERIRSVRDQRNTASDDLTRLQKRLKEIESDRDTCRKLLDTQAQEVRYLEFWVEGFGKKGVRCYALDRTANVLNAYAAKYSQCLTDGEIEVVFKVQRQLTTGELTEDFQVQGLNRYGSDVYKGNSVGERQRVDMSVSLALQDLIRSRLSSGINLFVCDEAAANLDREGSERMLLLLKDIAQEGRAVFYVTHDTQVQDLFDHTVRVVKENGVSVVMKGEQQ